MKKIKFLMPIATIAAIAPMATMVACKDKDSGDSLEDIKGYTAKCAQFVPEAEKKYDTQEATTAYFNQNNIKEIIKDDMLWGLATYVASGESTVEYVKANVNVEKVEKMEKTIGENKVTAYGLSGQIQYEYKDTYAQDSTKTTETVTVKAKLNRVPFELAWSNDYASWMIKPLGSELITSGDPVDAYEEFFDDWSLEANTTYLQIDPDTGIGYGDVYINKDNKNHKTDFGRVESYLEAGSHNFAEADHK